MRTARGDHDSAHAIEATRRTQAPTMTSRDQCREIAGRSATHEYSAGRIREPGQVGQPTQGLVLGEGGSGPFEPRTGVDAARRHDHVEDHRCLGGRARNEGKKTWMIDRDARRCENVDEQLQRTIATNAVGGDGLAHGRQQFVVRLRCVERHRIHPDAIERVLQRAIGEMRDQGVVSMHRLSLPCRSASDTNIRC